jgi:Enoyl-CoA hydratase/isomerase
MSKVLYEKRGETAYITLNRPEVHNAIDRETDDLLFEAWSDFRDDPEIRLAILTGAGDKSSTARKCRASTRPDGSSATTIRRFIPPPAAVAPRPRIRSSGGCPGRGRSARCRWRPRRCNREGLDVGDVMPAFTVPRAAARAPSRPS